MSSSLTSKHEQIIRIAKKNGIHIDKINGMHKCNGGVMIVIINKNVEYNIFVSKENRPFWKCIVG